jgi:hypothetical protein
MPAASVCEVVYKQARGQAYKAAVAAAGGLKQLCDDARELEFLADGGCGRIKLVAAGGTPRSPAKVCLCTLYCRYSAHIFFVRR